jgi:hypothetical protein
MAAAPAPQSAPVAAPAPAAKPKRARMSGGWRTVLQFVIGLLVIAGVAAAVIALYLRYYQ